MAFFWVVVGFFLLVSLFICLSVCVEWWIKFTEAMYIKWTGIKEYFLVRIAFFSSLLCFLLLLPSLSVENFKIWYDYCLETSKLE